MDEFQSVVGQTTFDNLSNRSLFALRFAVLSIVKTTRETPY